MDDLISRAALLDEFRSLCGPQTGDGWDNMGVRNLIMRQKAVDAAPVVHGRWVYEHDDPVLLPCSVCGYQVYRYNNTNYCPDCGAKMDGERRDADVKDD